MSSQYNAPLCLVELKEVEHKSHKESDRLDKVIVDVKDIKYMIDGVMCETLKDVDDDNYLVIVVDEAYVIFELKQQVVWVVYARVIVVDEAYVIFELKQQVVWVVYARYLHGNRFSGEILWELKNITNLTYLIASSSINGIRLPISPHISSITKSEANDPPAQSEKQINKIDVVVESSAGVEGVFQTKGHGSKRCVMASLRPRKSVRRDIHATIASSSINGIRLPISPHISSITESEANDPPAQSEKQINKIDVVVESSAGVEGVF
nr:hypothetical protein [Tanacetum cinerariifolium]